MVVKSHTLEATTKVWAGSYSLGEGSVEPGHPCTPTPKFQAEFDVNGEEPCSKVRTAIGPGEHNPTVTGYPPPYDFRR